MPPPESIAATCLRIAAGGSLLLCLAAFPALPAEKDALDARSIVRRAVAAEQRNWELARNYGFAERVDARRLDAQGRLKSTDIRSYDVSLLEGSPYRRLAARDDRPLPPGDEKKERENFDRSTADRRKESALQRSVRLAEYVQRPNWQREAWNELADAFDFQQDADDMWEGHHCYVLQATPHPGYQPRSGTGKIMLHLKGKFWVDKQNYQLVKAEVEALDTIAVGLILVRVAKGSRAALELSRVDDQVWLPRRVQVFASARVGLLKELHIAQEVIYSECREFPGEPRMLSESRTH